ncbi:hypothetical protein PQI66_09795 [Corynebacterium sp. USCH3]|uniref:phage tail tube protein n=1 Tax=Corynebacterium sp. USCH3 TaxID=3024840 RepID=UPI00309F16A4
MATVAKAPSSNDLQSTLARDWAVQVDLAFGTSDSEDANWAFVRGLSQFAPSFTPGMQDDSDIDSEGYGSQIATTIAAKFEGQGRRKGKTAEGNFKQDPGQAYVRRVGRKMGLGNVLRARCWRTDGVDEGYEGLFSVEYTETAGANDALDEFSFSMQSRGKPTEIHPVESAQGPSVPIDEDEDETPGNGGAEGN